MPNIKYPISKIRTFFLLVGFVLVYSVFAISTSKPIFADDFHQDFMIGLGLDEPTQRQRANDYPCPDRFNHSHHEEPIQTLYSGGPPELRTVTGFRVNCTQIVPPVVPPPPPDTPIGKITPPDTIPSIQSSSGDPSYFIAGLVRASLQILLIVAFILALIWTIFAGYRFIFAGGDPKTITAAWSQIYWGLLGMVIVLGAFAIIRLAEAFFNVHILSGDFQLPQR